MIPIKKRLTDDNNVKYVIAYNPVLFTDLGSTSKFHDSDTTFDETTEIEFDDFDSAYDYRQKLYMHYLMKD